MTDSDDSEASDVASTAQIVRAEYRERLRHLAAIDDLRMRSRIVLESLLDRSPSEALFWLEHLIRGSIWGRQDDLDVMLGLVHWLAQNERGGAHYEFFERLYRRAHEHERTHVLSFLRNPPPHLALGEEADLPDVRLPIDRDEITVGERRTIARRADRDTLKRLVLDPEPLVIENLLDNPDLVERDVLKIAARRPTEPEILRKLVEHWQWFSRSEVRKALVMNPYNPTGLSLKLLPTIGIRELRRVAHGSDLHPALREFADELVEARESHTSPWNV